MIAPNETLVQRHKLTAFIVLTFLFSWAFWIPSIASSRGMLSFELPIWFSLFGNFGPALAALVVLGLTRGRAGIVDLLRALMKWKVSCKLYSLAFIPLMFNFLLLAAYALLSNTSPDLSLTNILLFIPTFLFWLVVGGPLGEEIGWRGYALPILQKKYNSLKSALILALVWFLWHIVRYLDPRMAMGGVPAIILFAVQVTILSILFTWIYNKANGALLIAVIFHAAINSLAYIFEHFFALRVDQLGEYFNLINLVFALLLLVWGIIAAVDMFRKGSDPKATITG